MATVPLSQKEGQEANLQNHHIQEAANIWSMAKQLGATGGAEQDILIDKIKSMEERDRNEAERLGNSSSSP